MYKLICFCLSIFIAACSYAQETNLNYSIFSSSAANNEVVYTLGDIHIDDTSGALGTNSFQLFYKETVSVDFPFETNIKVYPNPTSNYLTVMSDNIIETVKIIDVLGKEILNTSNNENINLIEVEAGAYIVIVNGKESFIITKQ